MRHSRAARRCGFRFIDPCCTDLRTAPNAFSWLFGGIACPVLVAIGGLAVPPFWNYADRSGEA
jgi:hypothetical protein